MKYFITHFIILIFVGIIFAACSDLNENLTQPIQLDIHKTGISTPTSSNFHALKLKESNYNLISCQQCHGASYDGGTVGESCNTCHIFPGGPEACNTCHGDFSDPDKIAPPSDLDGNVATTYPGVGAHTKHLYDIAIGENVECYECHPSETTGDNYVYGHIDGQPAEMHFGAFTNSGISDATYDYNSATCGNTYCHGNFEFSKTTSEYKWAYDENIIAGNSFTPVWNIVNGTQASCGTCHGLPPTGHIAAILTQCVNCHFEVVDKNGNIINNLKHLNGTVNVAGSGACNTCHGNSADPTRIAPPTDLDGNTSTTAQGVGAHDKHLYGVQIGGLVECYECHPSVTEGSGTAVFNHIDGKPAELLFGDFTNSGVSAANYNFENATCQNTYCHGNFAFSKVESEYKWAYDANVISGSSFTPVWNIVDGSQAACGTCHGLPPTGHIPAELNECINCHAGIVDNQGNIIDSQKHMNGEANVFGN